MSAIAAQRAVRGRFLDIQHTVCQAAEIAQAVRYTPLANAPSIAPRRPPVAFPNTPAAPPVKK